VIKKSAPTIFAVTFVNSHPLLNTKKKFSLIDFSFSRLKVDAIKLKQRKIKNKTETARNSHSSVNDGVPKK
jgi:hypothetical protein